MILTASRLLLIVTLVFAESALAAPCDTTKKKCIVEISVTGAPGSYTVTMDPDPVQVPEGERRKEYRIIFKLPNLFVFKPAMGDGVWLKDPDQDEFYDPHLSDDDNGNASTVKKGWRRFVWRYINSVDGRYRYKIQFHDSQGNLLTGDPVITNLDTK